MSRISIFFRNTVLLALVAIIFSQCSFSRFARKSFERAEAKKPFDVIIVPGVPYNGARTSSVMNIRLFWAKFLYDSGITKNIIFSGSAVYTPYVEGVAMKIMADSLGVPEWKTFSETRAEHSTENIYYSWKLAKNLGFEKIALASDPFQSRMLKSFIRRYCPQVELIPIVFGTMDMEERRLPTIDPRTAYVGNFISIKERETFWQRLRGTLGKRVKNEVKAEARAKNGKISAEETSGN